MKTIKLIYRTILILVGLIGLYLNMMHGNFGELLHYFTILSNILVVVFFIFILITKKDYSKLKGAVTMSITVTGLIFHFLLSKSLFNMGSTFAIANTLVHYVVPIMTILDWLLFDEKGKYKATDPLLWLIIPFAYFIISSIVGFFGYTFRTGSHYPYFFMDWDQLGVCGVLKYVVLIIITFTILGYIYYGIDRLLRRKK